MEYFGVVVLLCLSVVTAFKLTINVNYPENSFDRYLKSDMAGVNPKQKTHSRKDGMFVRGDASLGLNWDSGVEMEYVEENRWSLTISVDGKQTVGGIKALVNDETWQIGSNEIIEWNNTGKEEYSLELFPFFFTNQGTLYKVKDVYSKEFGNNRDVITYLPPSFHENTLKKYQNILIMHDGQNLFDPDTCFSVPWWCQNAANDLINKGDIDEVVIVGLDNTNGRMEEYTYSVDKEYGGGQGDLYLDFIENEVFDLIESHFDKRLSIDRDHLGILGSSLGGLISCYAGWTRSDVYKKIGCMSSSLWWNNNDFNTTIMYKKLPDRSTIFYLDTGDVNDCYDSNIVVRSHFLNQFDKYFIDGENFNWYLDKGATHSEYYWGKRFWRPMTILYPVESHILE